MRGARARQRQGGGNSVQSARAAAGVRGTQFGVWVLRPSLATAGGLGFVGSREGERERNKERMRGGRAQLCRLGGGAAAQPRPVRASPVAKGRG
ncbi:hypothetical protein TIFTF001_007397 [Ficus carica]|uniref:Uncharacterized protein n=1 Tax=Ficus carica TaxID=3494 RepID=A0AA87ZQ17_FICCA|nr:hypothetical protein TIFTF001_007397 [Ficus carica]